MLGHAEGFLFGVVLGFAGDFFLTADFFLTVVFFFTTAFFLAAFFFGTRFFLDGVAGCSLSQSQIGR